MLETRESAPEGPLGVVFRAAGPPHISIDSNGNLTQRVEGSTTWTYEWNAENQLTRVLSNSSEVARYKYDPLGRRVEKVAGSTTTAWAYDGDDILRETVGAATWKYIHAELDEPLAKEDGTGVLTHHHADGLGSVVRTTDASGAVVTSYGYDAFGVMTGGAGGYAYTGREWDPTAQLYYYRARYYEPNAGRFVSEDPIGFDAGINFYSYVYNNPLRFTDPFGLDVTVCFYPEAAAGFGHVGFGTPGDPGTSGYYPKGKNPLSTPGQILPDQQKDKTCKIIPASTEQDECMRRCRAARAANPGQYKLLSNQCTSFVRDCLKDCKLPSGTYQGPKPRPFFQNLPNPSPPPTPPPSPSPSPNK